MNPNELRQKRAAILKEYRDIVAKDNADAQDLERADKLWAEGERLLAQAEKLEKADGAIADLDRSIGEPNRPDPQAQNSNGNGADAEKRKLDVFERTFGAWATQDFRGVAPDDRRALQADLDASGGYLRPPQVVVDRLIKDVDDMVFMRQRATKFSVGGSESLGVPTLENDPADADWTTELATGSEDNSMSFGKRELHPHPLAKRIKISRKLLRSVPSAQELVRGRLSYKFAITQEKGFLLGSGASQPLGVFTPSDKGISTGRDVSTGNTATAMSFDGLKEAKYTLKGAYHGRAAWMFHRAGVKQLAKIKDGEGQYIWQQSVVANEPDTLLGFPVGMSEYVPSTFTTGLYVGILGDFSHYWIADAQTLEFQLLNELYAETNQVGLIGRLDCDGMPTLEEAFVRVKLA